MDVVKRVGRYPNFPGIKPRVHLWRYLNGPFDASPERPLCNDIVSTLAYGAAGAEDCEKCARKLKTLILMGD